MIFNQPENWKQLQEYVNLIFVNIGFDSHVEKNIITPRGDVDIDVFAIDVNSVNKDKYIVECKWWNNKIPQTVIHAFTTVMSETGGNFGFIITKEGLQSGAIKYLDYTNIKALTFVDFQKIYFSIWYNKYFRPRLIRFSGDFMQYTETFNSKRFKCFDKLNDIQKDRYFELVEKYETFSFIILGLTTPNNHPQFENLDELKQEAQNIGLIINSNCFTDLLHELEQTCKNVVNEFNELFGENIFNS